MARKPSYDVSTAEGQKRLMAESVGHYCADMPRTVRNVPGADYGCDPLPDGKFRMVPSGDIVDLAERTRRLKR